MKRLMYNPKSCTHEWKEYIPEYVNDFGKTVTKQKKNIPTKVMVNNQEVQSGNNRVALYTMPGGVDTGVRYSPLYEHSGLDVTEVEANKRALQKAKVEVEGKIKEEFEKIANETAEAVKATTKASKASSSSETES